MAPKGLALRCEIRTFDFASDFERFRGGTWDGISLSLSLSLSIRWNVLGETITHPLSLSLEVAKDRVQKTGCRRLGAEDWV